MAVVVVVVVVAVEVVVVVEGGGGGGEEEEADAEVVVASASVVVAVVEVLVEILVLLLNTSTTVSSELLKFRGHLDILDHSSMLGRGSAVCLPWSGQVPLRASSLRFRRFQHPSEQLGLQKKQKKAVE